MSRVSQPSEKRGETPGYFRRSLSRVLTGWRAYRDDEEGALLIFALICFIGMLVGAGMAIDFMRVENERVKLQATMDRALLAAASLSQTLEAEDVVIDYFAKSGLVGYDLSVTVDEGINFKTISGTVETPVRSNFLNMVGIDTLLARVTGVAEERIDKIEISLVVDVSGSMGWYNRLTNLKAAAKDFVQDMHDGAKDGDISINIVPYNHTVILTDRFAQEFNLTSEHSSSNCVVFDDEDFNTAALLPTQSIDRMAHFDPSTTDSTSPIDDPWCYDSDNHLTLLPYEVINGHLISQIETLTAGGNTAADIGMKWGVALLDPSTRPVLTSLIATSDADSDLSGRPVDYSDTETIKIVILMTDGENSSQYDIVSSRKSGNSDIWYDSDANVNDSDKYSVYDSDTNQWFYPHDSTWNDFPVGGDDGTSTTTECSWVKRGSKYKWICVETEASGEPGTGSALQMTWPEVWDTFAVEYGADYLYSWSTSLHDDFLASSEQIVNGSSSDTRLLNICTAAKNAGITVFTIGFEAPTDAQAIMESCATSPSHYYDVDGLEIADAFEAIVATIQKLKLVE